MRVFRRSVKADKSDSNFHHISITPKSATAIVPPKKVIKAKYDYSPDPNDRHKLAFHKGDFFHVISREDDPEWYEACNPLIPNARGLVPVTYFEIIGKTERQSTGSTASGPPNAIPPHDSGYSEKGGHPQPESSATATHPGHQRTVSMGRGSGAMVYGIVQYDFNAERDDELDAKAGEAIIVIAQSNPEWFVAKPIGRLGGPGLIPVSFIEIRDMTTGDAVLDVQGVVARAGVPKVEEWKRMVADYKNSSITLGKFEGGGVTSMPRESDRMSPDGGGGRPPTSANGNGSYAHGPGYHQRNGSRFPPDGYGRESPHGFLAPISALIPRYCYENDKYWYIIECVMEDGRHWELSRAYQNFYDFQIALLQQFPKEADYNSGTRVLPFMPGPVSYVTDSISNGRRESLDDYVKKLLALPPYISKCQLVRELFAPREGDFELDPRAVGEDYRLSGTSLQSSTADSLSRTASRRSSRGRLNGNGGYPPHALGPHQHRISQPRSQNSVSGTNGPAAGPYGYRTHPNFPPQATINHQASSLTQASSTSSGTVQSASAPNSSTTNVVSSGALKIKVWFEDDCIAIRVPSDITFEQLKGKVQDRLKIQGEIMVHYRDESTGNFVVILTDHDLDVGAERNPKLQLYVGYAS